MAKKSYDEKIGTRIRDIRKSLGFSQRDFAKKIGATPSAVSNWEQGANKPNNERLTAIAELGGISVYDLLDPLQELYDSADKEALGKYIKFSRLSQNEEKDELVELLKADDIFSGEKGVNITVEQLEAIEAGEIKPSYEEVRRLFSVLNIQNDCSFEDFLKGNTFQKINKNHAMNWLGHVIDDFDENKGAKMIETMDKIPVFDRNNLEIHNLYSFLDKRDDFESVELVKDFYKYSISDLERALDSEDYSENIDFLSDISIEVANHARKLNKIEAYEEVYLND